MKEEKLVALCKKQKSSAQKKVYEMYAPFLRTVCRRYISDFDNAEEVLLEGFFRVFTKIDSFTWNGEKSFFGWMKRIMINTAINYLKKHKTQIQEEQINEQHDSEVTLNDSDFFDDTTARYSKEDVIEVFQKIPEQFRLVLNMAILDEMKHKEIAQLLNIAEETSRSRLTRGKRLFRDLLTELDNKRKENISYSA